MDIENFINQVRIKYNYSEEMVQFLHRAIPSIITYYGDDKTSIILETINNCEIHIQKEGEDINQYLNQYFGTKKNWDIPSLGGAFQDTELSIENNIVKQKNIIYIKTDNFGLYKPFDFNNDEKISAIIHEMCHAIKGYGKLKTENGKIITSTGLSKDYYEYDRETNSFINNKSDHVGLEEALNSYDEASIMTIMTGIFHEFGGYKDMTKIARKLMKHEELAQIIKLSQFSGGNEWMEFLGKEDSEYLSKNFQDWANILYSPMSDLLDEKLGLLDKMSIAIENVNQFANNYTSPKESKKFDEFRKKADENTLESVRSIIRYKEDNNSFEAIEEPEGKTL